MQTVWCSRFRDLPIKSISDKCQTKSVAYSWPFCPQNAFLCPKTHLICAFVSIYSCLANISIIQLDISWTSLHHNVVLQKLKAFVFFVLFLHLPSPGYVFNSGHYGVWHSLWFLICCILLSEEGVNGTVTVCELPVSGENCGYYHMIKLFSSVTGLQCDRYRREWCF